MSILPIERKTFMQPTRRLVLGGGLAALGLGLAPAFLRGAAAGPKWPSDPFSLGVAAGSPSADGFVIWTRLAPDPLSPDPRTPGGMSGPAVPVAYEIAADAGLRQIVRKGTAMADPAFGYSVHAEVTGLQPGRSYWYRFMSGGAASRTGRALTTPAAGAPLDRLRFGFVSCANYEQGYFSAYRHLADENPDMVIFLGDYIYEYVDRKSPDLVRRHSDDMEAVTLGTYRNRYAQYRLDADLQRLHAEAPALVTWDDHEVQNDYADQWSMTLDAPGRFLERRAAAYQAYYEFMPLRPSARPSGPALRLHDRYSFGDLLEINMLDGRQYRSREACYGPPDKGRAHLETSAACPERLDPARSMLGQAQESWLYAGFAASKARWNVLGQGTLMARLRQPAPGNDWTFWTDDWNGYPAGRDRLLRSIQETALSNPVVLSGDIHSFWTNDLKADFDDPNSATVATEFVGTSVTSYAPPYDMFAKLLPDNPDVRFFDSRARGYVSCDLDAQRMTTRFRALSDAHDAHATVSTLKSFVVENGKAGALEG